MYFQSSYPETDEELIERLVYLTGRVAVDLRCLPSGKLTELAESIGCRRRAGHKSL